MITYCEQHQQIFDTDRFEECPRCADNPKPKIPAMPEESKYFMPITRLVLTPQYQDALKKWGRECANLAQREAALAGELVKALEKISNAVTDLDSMEGLRSIADAALARYGEAR